MEILIVGIFAVSALVGSIANSKWGQGIRSKDPDATPAVALASLHRFAWRGFMVSGALGLWHLLG